MVISTAHVSAIREPAADVRRPCEWCGHALADGHGNRRYHAGPCAEEARKDRHRRNQAAYRGRLASPPELPEVPEDFKAGRVTVRGIVMPGADSAALRAAALPVMLSGLAFHQALKTVPFEDVLNNAQLNRLRGFVDDALALVEALNELIPVAAVESDEFDPSDGLNIIKRLHVGKTRPARQRAAH